MVRPVRPRSEDALNHALQLPRFSIGMGDRFGHQAHAQLAACIRAARLGVDVTPVWNKSNREHTIMGSDPAETRAAADAAVHDLGWRRPYFVDADHITLGTVSRFVAPCDFFTIDVAEQIAQPATPEVVDDFLRRHPELLGDMCIPGIPKPFHTDEQFVRAGASRFLVAVRTAGQIFRSIADAKGRGNFVVEISMDETERPQTLAELLLILAAIADEQIPIQAIAPRFTGRFNKGVEYAGDLALFAQEFNQDLAAIAFSIERFGLPSNLKLSVHSGSDKFSLYPILHQALKRTGAGVHLKTAGTTWLEELTGLAEAGGDALTLVKEIYREALAHMHELTGPYASVIDIDSSRLPSVAEEEAWSSEEWVAAVRHRRQAPSYNPDLRQLLHVGFKIVAARGGQFRSALASHSEVIGKNVTVNLFEHHIRPVFLGA